MSDNYKKIIEEAREKIHSTFNGLQFKEDTHQYFVNGKEYDCVSNFTHNYKPYANFDEIAKRYAIKHGFDGPYWTQKWKELADDACNMGTQVHEFAESIAWYKDNQPDKICESSKNQLINGRLEPIIDDSVLSLKEQAARKFWDDMIPDLHFVLAETSVYTGVGEFSKTTDVNYAGTFDLLLYYHNEADESKDGFCIFDYKGLPVDTPIMTDSGWMKMGDISTADKVLDKNGKWTKIKHVSEIHHNPCMKLYFSNGHSIVADSDHRWLVCINDEEQVKTTSELKDYMNEHKYYRPDFPKISICNSVDKIDTSIANGSLPAVYMNFWDFLFFCKGSRLTNKKKDFLKNRYVFFDSDDIPIFNMGLMDRSKKIEILNHITDCNIANTYFDYFEDSENTDGKRNVKVIFKTKLLRKNIISLISSLGISCDINSKTDIVSFVLDYDKDTKEYVYIDGIDNCKSVPTRCIEVDSDTHTYLAGYDFIVTHNTNKTLLNDYSRSRSTVLLNPFGQYYDEPLGLYTIQQSCYQIPLENIGLKVIARRLVHLGGDGNYMLVPLDDVTQSIRTIIEK